MQVITDPKMAERLERLAKHTLQISEAGDGKFLLSYRGVEQVVSEDFIGRACKLMFDAIREPVKVEDKAAIAKQMRKAVDDAIAAGHPITRKRPEAEFVPTAEQLATIKKLGISL